MVYTNKYYAAIKNHAFNGYSGWKVLEVTGKKNILAVCLQKIPNLLKTHMYINTYMYTYKPIETRLKRIQ